MKGWLLLVALVLGILSSGVARGQVPSGSIPFQTLLTVKSDGLATYQNETSSVITITQAFCVQGSQNGGAFTASNFIYVDTYSNAGRNGDAVLFADKSGVVNSDSTAPFRFVLQPGDAIEVAPFGGSNAVSQVTLLGYSTPKSSALDWQGNIELQATSTATSVAGSYTNTSTHSELITDFSFVSLTNSTSAVPFTYVRCYTQAPVTGHPGSFTTTGTFAEPSLETYSVGTSFRTRNQNFILGPGHRILLTATRQGSNGAISVRLTASGTTF